MVFRPLFFSLQDPIDEEGRGALHSAAFATLHIFLDAGKIALLYHIMCVLLHIQTNRLGKTGQIGPLRSKLLKFTPLKSAPFRLTTGLKTSGCCASCWVTIQQGMPGGNSESFMLDFDIAFISFYNGLHQGSKRPWYCRAKVLCG